MGFNLSVTIETEIVIRTGGAFVSDAENAPITAIADDVGVESGGKCRRSRRCKARSHTS